MKRLLFAGPMARSVPADQPGPANKAGGRIMRRWWQEQDEDDKVRAMCELTRLVIWIIWLVSGLPNSPR
jgi:hypothetical protein